MKKSNWLIILILSIILIISGIGICLFSNNSTKTEKYSEVRDYKKVVEVENNKINQVEPTEKGYIELVKKVGFDNVICEESQSDLKNITCKGTKKGYTNSDLMDFIAHSYVDNKVDSFALILYFHQDDYTTKNITNKLNNVLTNFFGSNITSSQIEEIKKGLEFSDEDIYIKNYISGEYTYELNIQPVANEDFYVVKYIVMKTNLYNEYFK